MADWLDDVVAPRESGNRPYIGWRNTDLTPWLRAGKTVYGFPDWPGLPSGTFDRNGRELPSTAGGLYQITKSNWMNLAPKLGVNDFSPASQRKVADALMATQGRSAWAASEPGYKSGLRRTPAGPPEGYYDSALHLTLRPDRQTPFPMDAALDGLLAGQPGEGPGTESPLLMLDALLTPPQGDAAQPQQPADGDFIEPPALPGAARNILAEDLPLSRPETQQLPSLTPASYRPVPTRPDDPNVLLNQLLGDTIEPPALGRGPPPAPKTSVDVGTGIPIEPGRPAAVMPPDTMLDQLLKGAADIGQFVAGGAEHAAAGALNTLRMPGQDIIRTQIPMAEGAKAAEGLGTFATGGLASSLFPGTRMLGQGAREAGRVAGDVSREAAGAVPGVLASEQGAISLPPAVTKALGQAGKGIEKVFSPASVDAFSEAGEALIRQSVGRGRRATERAEAQVSRRGPLANPPAADMVEAAREPWRPLVQRYVPEFEAYIRSKQPGYAGPPVADPALLRFIDFVETRSRGTAYAGPPELRPLADTLRKIYKERELAIAAEPSTSGSHFITDYFAHQFRDSAAVARGMGSSTGRQGSGRALRQRSIPTLRDAIDQGHVPVTPDPIDMTMQYVSNMDRYLAHNRIFRVGRDSNMIRFYGRGAQPDGWMPLEGRLADRAVATGGVPGALGLKAYAPEGFARVYNNTVALGFMQGELGAKAYQAALHTKNAITQSVLSLSGFHAMAMAQEASASALASGIQGLKAGDIAWGLKQLGLGAIPGLKAGKDTFGLGRKLERQYLGVQDYGPDYERIVKLYADAGGRAIGRGAEYQGTAADNYFTSFRRGHLAMDLKAGLRHVGEGNPLYAPARAVGFVAHELARINETVTMPLFDKMVPRLKSAAFFDEMGQWLKKNPNAAYPEQVAMARQLQETMDDRFGELVMDNLFWGRRAKQSMQLMATSLGWEHGSIRSIGGSAFDAIRGQFSPRVRYVIGLGMAIAMTNGVYQFLKTGTYPGQDKGGMLSAGGALDLTAPRTGGKTPEGANERALLPGFEKDILGYMHNPITELAGKLTPAGRLLVDFYTGRDYFGREIAPFPAYTPEWFKAYANHVVAAAMPIPMKQEQLKGTAIGTAERYMGNRPAAERWQNPQRQDQMETTSHIRALKGQLMGLQSHGVRTQQDRKEIADKIRDIGAKIAKLQGDFQERTKERRGSKPLYFSPPPKDKLRPSVGGP